jgi:flagella basal body P-ring formation protein FlgA
MTLAMSIAIPLLLSAAAAGGRAACLPLAGDRVRAEDMARVVPAFAGLSAGLVLGYLPAAGARRTYGAAELGRLARRYGIAIEPGTEACFERPLEKLARPRVEAALAASMPTARLEVLDFSHQPVPPGELHFEPKAAGAGSAELWSGEIRQPGVHGFPVWASVRIRMAGMRTVAAAPLPAGVPIARAQLRAEAYEGPAAMPEPSQVVGRAPRRPIPAGAAIQAAWLEEPAAVRGGERVEVEVRSGPARLRFEGWAQSSGRPGEAIKVRNPANGKIFRATVADRGRVTVAAGPPDRDTAEAQ